VEERDVDRLLNEQIAYYQARAGEYDEWFLRQGRYDRGAEANRQWFVEIAEVATALERFAPRGRVLELACGTGWWTERLVRHATHITAVDSSPEVLAINRARMDGSPIDYVQADLFTWRPTLRYDVVFFSFWLSHVPPERFVEFWAMVRTALAPGGRVFFIDSLYSHMATAVDQALPATQVTTSRRRLNDGQEFHIVKVFYGPDDLVHQLSDLSWHAQVRSTASHFLYGSCACRTPTTFPDH